MSSSAYPNLYPDQPNGLTLAVQWVAALLTGSIAISVAIVAIASVGALMLDGRLSLRRGATVTIGCFILFSSSSIASALTSSTEPEENPPAVLPPMPASRQPATLSPPTDTYDPYGGVAVPGRTTESHDLF